MKKTHDVEVTTSVQKSQEAQYSLDPESFFVNCSWGSRPYGVAINEALYHVFIVELKQSTDRDNGSPEVKEVAANEQYKSIISTPKVAAPKWEFNQINFVVGNRCGGLVVENDCYIKLRKLDVHERKKDKLFADHVTQVCKLHNQVNVSIPPAGAS